MQNSYGDGLNPYGTSATAPDWTREEKTFFSWQPSRSLLASIRAYQRNVKSKNPLRWIAKKIAVMRHLFWSVVTGADIPLNSRLGGGLRLPHPNGIVIHPSAEIGPNCTIFQQVTIGARKGRVPTIGGEVEIYAGAKIIGKVHVGNHARIATNAVVLQDVPENGTTIDRRSLLRRSRRHHLSKGN
jgi:serine O-acetyltransferase